MALSNATFKNKNKAVKVEWTNLYFPFVTKGKTNFFLIQPQLCSVALKLSVYLLGVKAFFCSTVHSKNCPFNECIIYQQVHSQLSYLNSIRVRPLRVWTCLRHCWLQRGRLQLQASLLLSKVVNAP